jgi:hypothetical protein
VNPDELEEELATLIYRQTPVQLEEELLVEELEDELDELELEELEPDEDELDELELDELLDDDELELLDDELEGGLHDVAVAITVEGAPAPPETYENVPPVHVNLPHVK